MTMQKYDIADWTAPEGTTVDWLPGTTHCVVITLHGGSVTVDLRDRIFDLGACQPRNYNSRKLLSFKGAGWKRTGQQDSVSAGAPDVLVQFRGGFACWIETKSRTGRMGKAQEAYLPVLTEAQIPVRVCTSTDDAVDWVKKLAQTWMKFYAACEVAE